MAKRAVTYQRGYGSFVLEGAEELIEMIKKIGDIAAGAAVMEAVLAGGKVLEDEITTRAPGPHIVRSPNKRSLKRGWAEVDVGPDKEHWYYRFFETGASPHEIEPVTAEALVLIGGNLREYVLHHPGMGANPFMRPAFDTSQDEVMKKVGEVLWEELHKVR